jgi:hypothetical protein
MQSQSSGIRHPASGIRHPASGIWHLQTKVQILSVDIS